MEIEEIIFSKEAVINTSDPHTMAAGILDTAFSFGEVVEKKNLFQTDGPLRRTIMEFDVVRHYDDYSKFVVSVVMNGETNLRSALEIEMKGTVKTAVDDNGFFSSVFAEFYLENIYRNASSRAKSDIRETQKRFERVIETLAKKK